MSWLFVACGGALGAMLRFLCVGVIASVNSTFPYGTVTVNILGSFLIGVFTPLLFTHSDLKLFFITGFLGAFTTFSTFSLESMALLQRGEYEKALLNIGLNVILCLVAVYLGLQVSRYR